MTPRERIEAIRRIAKDRVWVNFQAGQVTGHGADQVLMWSKTPPADLVTWAIGRAVDETIWAMEENSLIPLTDDEQRG